MPQQANHRPIVISLGGSLIVPDHINIPFLKAFRKFILSQVKRGRRFILIVGGGKTSRVYQHAAKTVSRLTPEDLDWIGIHASRLNAHLLRTIFRDIAHPRIITSKEKINPRIHASVIIGAGFRPGSSTDLRAVQLAKAYGAQTVINLSNIDWVYSKDPKRFRNAKKIPKMHWVDFRKLVGATWDPGAHVPFDPIASKWAQKWNLEVIITKGTRLKNIDRIISRTYPFIGTIVSSRS